MRSFERGAVIYDEVLGAESVCVLISGVARITCSNCEGERVLVELIGPGDVVGNTALLPQTHQQIRCEAFVDCIAGVIPAAELVQAVVGEAYQDFGISLQLLIGRWWQMLMRYAHFLDQDLERRIALTLLSLALKIGTPKERYIVLNAPVTHRDIADLVGGSRPKVTKYLTHLAAEGLIVRDGRRIAIAARALEDLVNRRPSPARETRIARLH